jgi:hypothetical protein
MSETHLDDVPFLCLNNTCNSYHRTSECSHLCYYGSFESNLIVVVCGVCRNCMPMHMSHAHTCMFQESM